MGIESPRLCSSNGRMVGEAIFSKKAETRRPREIGKIPAVPFSLSSPTLAFRAGNFRLSSYALTAEIAGFEDAHASTASERIDLQIINAILHFAELGMQNARPARAVGIVLALPRRMQLRRAELGIAEPGTRNRKVRFPTCPEKKCH